MKLFNKILFLFIFIDIINCCAQDTVSQTDNSQHFILAKLNVTSLFDYTPSFQLSYQYNLYDKIHLQHEAGYINHFLSPFWNSDSEMEGFRIKNQLKYYVMPFGENDIFYISGEVMYKKISYFEEKEFAMYDFAYFERKTYKKSKKIWAFSLLLGFEPVISKKNIILDIYSGIGFRHLYVDKDLPDGYTMVGWHFFNRGKGFYNMPGFYFGIRLGYKFASFFKK